MLRLLIANSSEVFASALARQLEDRYHIRICTDGVETLSSLTAFQPDILILHTAMPRKDSLSILRQMSARPKLILGISNFSNDRLCRQLMSFGVQEILISPTVRTVVQCLSSMEADLQNGNTRHSLEHLTATYLHILHFPNHLDGYRQVYVGLPMLCRNPQQQIFKELYPAIAETLGFSDWRTVERSIRKAIQDAWARRDDVVWASYFPADKDGHIPCPSNKQFLHRMAEVIAKEADL